MTKQAILLITERPVINGIAMARPETVSDADLTIRIVGAFRANGFAGTSLGDLAQAVGLTKAALYHRFPGGKDAMAAAALEGVDRIMETRVLEPLKGAGPLRDRIVGMVAGLDHLYASGRVACLTDLFSMETASLALRAAVDLGTRRWIAALADALAENVEPATARARAQDAVMRIQGALVLCRALNDTQMFHDLLERLPDELTAPEISHRSGGNLHGA